MSAWGPPTTRVRARVNRAPSMWTVKGSLEVGVFKSSSCALVVTRRLASFDRHGCSVTTFYPSQARGLDLMLYSRVLAKPC